MGILDLSMNCGGEKMATLPVPLNERAVNGESESDRNPVRDEVSRTTPELVIGLVGPIGAGVSTAANVLKDILSNEYEYKTRIIKVRKLIDMNAKKVNLKSVVDSEELSESIKIVKLQEIGTELRGEFGEKYIAEKAVQQIVTQREMGGGYTKTSEVDLPRPLRQATIIDSLKHPKETELLRQVYGDVYWQFTIFAPENVRAERLRRNNMHKNELPGIFSKDANDENSNYGQKVSETAYLSDFFIRNDQNNDVRLIRTIQRYLGIAFNTSVNTPTRDEAGMLAAVSAATKSACLSRQVGAAIYSAEGEQISVGWNDVPKADGGFYTVEDGDKDHRCYFWDNKICHKDRKKK